ncbi:MAG: ATP-binding protein [Saprospiraceae bacterium]|nr:ATP-binding protein [Saprospiraceae bacterium]
MSKITSNASNLHAALAYLREIIAARLKVHNNPSEKTEIKADAYYQDSSVFAHFMEAHQPDFEEYTTLLLAFAPHLHPGFFDEIIAEHLPKGGDLAEFGGKRGANHRGILPTGETVQFIVAGDDLEKRIQIQQLFTSEHWFYRKDILRLESVPDGEPFMSGRLILDEEILELLTSGQVTRPRLSANFPAEYITTELEWSDLVLPEQTWHQIKEIENWLYFNSKLLYDWGMHRKIKPGYRALFHGAPGTGKTLTASLLGKYTKRDAFRIDLSKVVSKYIGETEKNLDKIFHKAENKNWILFFDEADALFSKRTSVRDAHDRYANQEVSYLLQRIESYPGLIILASNFKSNIDEAFMRRFQSIVYFPIPKAPERLQLWQKAFPAQVSLASDIDLQKIAQQYELTGSNIINITQFCCLDLLSKERTELSLKELMNGIRREYAKEEKAL